MCVEYYVFLIDEKTMEAIEEKKSKPIGGDKPKSDINDKMLILEEGITSIIIMRSLIILLHQR